MLVYSGDEPDILYTPNDLICLVHRLGLLLMFLSTVSGFSVKEHTLAENW